MKLPKIQVSSDTPTALEKFQETKHGKSYKKKTLNQGKNDGASLKRTQDKREHFQWRQIKTAILASEKFGKRVGSGSYIPEDISSSTRSRPSQRDLRRRLSVYDVIQEQTTPENGGSDESNWEERSSSCSRRSGGSSRRSQSLYDVLEDDDWLRRMSLPSWALKEDIEAFLKNLECQERRTSLQSPDKPRTKRASTVALKRWSQRQRIGRERRPKTTALKLFRTVARVAILCAWACGNSYQRLEKMKRDTLPINQYMEEYYESTPNLSFDPSYYKVKKDQGLSLECKKLLQKPPTARTSKDIEMISENLRWNHAYMASPKKIQGLLCRHAWFESFGPHRTILRQGDRAYAVYFIVEGEALDSVADSKGGTTCTPLYRGVSFGNKVDDNSLES